MVSLSLETQELIDRADRAIEHSTQLKAARTLIRAETRGRLLKLETTRRTDGPLIGERSGLSGS